MRKFWWGIFFGSLVGVLLLAPQSNFSTRIRDLFYVLQNSMVAALDQEPLVFWSFLLISLALISGLGLISLYERPEHFTKQEIDEIQSKTEEERYLLQIRHSNNLFIIGIIVAIILTVISIFFGLFLGNLNQQ